MDASEFRRCGREMVDLVADYLENIRERQVLPDVQPGYMRELLPDHAPEEPDQWGNVIADVEKIVMPGMTHWHSPHFFAFFPTANSYPAICADILSSGLACIGFTWAASPACTELEMVMLDWFGKMLGLPRDYFFSSDGQGGGVIQGTASEATLVALLSARSRLLREYKKLHPAMEEAAILGKLVVYTSEQSHSSVERATMLGAVKVRLLTPDKDTLSLKGDTLRKAVKEDKDKGLIPFFVIATLGTTNTCAFDDLRGLGNTCKAENLWLHVDAAYAGSAFICPEYRDLMDGVELADSFNVNPHKWLLVNFDCSTMWVKNRNDLVGAFEINPEYLKHPNQGKAPDYRHWQIPLGRRFRSLKMWFVFRMYGVKGLQEHIRKQIALARYFQDLVEGNPKLHIFSKPRMGLVCFTVQGGNDTTETFVQRVNARKKIFLTPGKAGGIYFVRFAICSRFTEQKDVDFAWQEILRVLNDCC